MKSFLRGLKEPLVTYDLWKDFVHATGKENENAKLLFIEKNISQGANLCVRSGAIAPGNQLSAPDKHKN
jgi:hypothetical protein